MGISSRCVTAPTVIGLGGRFGSLEKMNISFSHSNTLHMTRVPFSTCLLYVLRIRCQVACRRFVNDQVVGFFAWCAADPFRLECHSAYVVSTLFRVPSQDLKFSVLGTES